MFDIEPISNKKIVNKNPVLGNVYLYQKDEVLKNLKEINISEKIVVNALEHKTARYENHEDLDIICIPKAQSLIKNGYNQCVHVFVQKGRHIFVCEDTKELSQMMETYREDNEVIEEWRILYDLLEKLLDKDQKEMESLEATIINLEDEVLLRKIEVKPLEKIVQYRKKLLYLKRYYEQLINIFSYIMANENQLFEKKALRYYKIQGEKVSRLYQSVLVLRDYVTQIREAYQAEEGIKLNKTMKLFTVIATIFMPLTLLVGWYGMNFDMPEFHWNYGYTIVIAISGIYLVCIISFFKRNKWF